jgi:hypothetical protein
MLYLASDFVGIESVVLRKTKGGGEMKGDQPVLEVATGPDPAGGSPSADNIMQQECTSVKGSSELELGVETGVSDVTTDHGDPTKEGIWATSRV